MSVVLKTLAESLAKVVNHQQALLELLVKDHMEVMGRANVEVILEASHNELEMVKMCVSCLSHYAPDMMFNAAMKLRERKK